MTTLDQAKDEVLTAFFTAWSLQAIPPVVYFDGLPDPARPLPGHPWAQVVIRHVSGRRVTFQPSHFEHTGIVTIAVYGIDRDDGQTRAEVARDAFEGQCTPGGVWFRDVKVVEVGADDAWYHWNVLAEFRWEES